MHTYAEGRIKKVYQSGGGYTRTLQITTQTHIGPNYHWFAGCSASVYVDIVASDGEILDTTPEHVAFAGAVFDPQGNDKNYTWVDVPEMADEDLDRIHHIDIRHVAH